MATKLKCNPYNDVIELSDELKEAIKAKYNLTKGSATLDEDDIKYLQGIKDGGTDSSALIVQITQHKKVELYIE